MSAVEDTCKIGDPDPTPSKGPHCEHSLGRWRSGFLCTRSPDHTGQHVAGDGSEVMAVWQ